MAHCRDVHMPPAARKPGLRRVTCGRCQGPAGKIPAHFPVVTPAFAGRAACAAATGRYLKNFAHGGVAMVVHGTTEVLPS